MLKLLLPTTLPMAMSPCRPSVARTEVASSRRLAPTLTIVSPIVAWLTPAWIAMSTAAITSRWPPHRGRRLALIRRSPTSRITANGARAPSDEWLGLPWGRSQESLVWS
jgi:hypothetical protein